MYHYLRVLQGWCTLTSAKCVVAFIMVFLAAEIRGSGNDVRGKRIENQKKNHDQQHLQ
jgi:hypothetical protein